MDTTADAPRRPRKAKAKPKSKPGKKDSKKKTPGAGKVFWFGRWRAVVTALVGM